MTQERPSWTVFEGGVRVAPGETPDNAKVQLTPNGNDLLVAQGLPPYTEITRLGGGWQAMATSAVAAVVVRPSTTAMATLYNNDVSQNRSLIMDAAFAHNLVGAANSVYSIWLCVHPVGMAVPTNDITARNSLSGRPAGGGAVTIFDNGATVVADGWFPWGLSEHTVTVTTPGGVVQADIAGRIIVPPTAAISMHVVADVTGATFTAGFRWYEKVITFGY